MLKYGSLPLSFESSEAETVSATLGLTSLRAGLIAGAIGLALVLVYSLLYYRVLGLLTALSLVASGAMVFAILVLLGRYIGYTLDLAGIAGLIIGIGTTADSFVVFFERIKDEIREGRSFRSAVPRGWARARKTILSGNAVSFLAAAVLYFLAVGQVKGFAFTLGLTTILDVVVVFLVTWPLVYLASKSTHAGQAGVQRPRRGAADRARTPGRRARDGTGIATMAARHRQPTRPTSSAVEAPEPRMTRGAGRCRSTASSSGSTRAPARSRSSGAASCGSRSAALIVAVAIASIVLRGFTFGIDFEGGTKVSMPAAASGTSPTQQVEDVFSKTLGKDAESVVVVGNGASATVQIRSETLNNAETEEAARPRCSTPSSPRAPTASPASRRSATRRCRRPGAARSPRRRSSRWWCSWCWSAIYITVRYERYMAIVGAGDAGLRPGRHRGRVLAGRVRGHARPR